MRTRAVLTRGRAGIKCPGWCCKRQPGFCDLQMGSDAFHHGHIARRALRDRVVILVGDIRFGDQDAADAGAGHSGVQVIAEVLRRNTADRQKWALIYFRSTQSAGKSLTKSAPA